MTNEETPFPTKAMNKLEIGRPKGGQASSPISLPCFRVVAQQIRKIKDLSQKAWPNASLSRHCVLMYEYA